MSDWRELASDAEIDEFVECFGNFHDGCIKEAFVWTGHCVAPDLSMTVEPWVNFRVLFQRQAKLPSAVEMVFHGLGELRWLPPPPNFDHIIFEAWLYWSGEQLVWANAPPGEKPDLLISARRLWCRDASDWMGSELRLGPNWTPQLA